MWKVETCKMRLVTQKGWVIWRSTWLTLTQGGSHCVGKVVGRRLQEQLLIRMKFVSQVLEVDKQALFDPLIRIKICHLLPRR